MTSTVSCSSATYEEACAGLAHRLRKRAPEIHTAILTRIQAAAPIEQDAAPEYLDGLREAIRAAIVHTIARIESRERAAPPFPSAVLGQARLASHHGVSLGLVLRRYSLGSHSISKFIVDEMEMDEYWQGGAMGRLLTEQAAILESGLDELEYEYHRERPNPPASPDARLVDLVKRRLAGELVDASELNYSFDAHHIGVVSEGENAAPLLRTLAQAVDARLLCVRPGGGVVWAWIGTRHRIDLSQLQSRLVAANSSSPLLAFGEPDHGSLGWCRTHQQAREAFPYAVREQRRAIRYADIALQAAIERHDLATLSLHQLYIAPLARHPDGLNLLAALRAYFAAGRNAAAAAAMLDVRRQTVSKRLRSVEALLRKPLDVCSADLEIALRLEDSH